MYTPPFPNLLKNISCTLVCIATLLFNTSISARSLPDIKTPSFMKVNEIQGGVNLGGMIVKTLVFKSSKGNKDIALFYNKLWKKQLKTIETKQWIYHSYFDGRYLFSIQVKNEHTGFFSKKISTSGIIGISEPGAVKERKLLKKELFYPLVPSTKILTDISSIDLGKKSRTTVFDSAGSVMQNLNHYKRHFETKGWKEVLNKMSSGMAKELGSSTLIMQKGISELIISFIPDEKGRTKVVSVLVRNAE